MTSERKLPGKVLPDFGKDDHFPSEAKMIDLEKVHSAVKRFEPWAMRLGFVVLGLGIGGAAALLLGALDFELLSSPLFSFVLGRGGS